MELGVGCEDVFRDGAQDIDAEVMVFGVLESRGDEFEGEAAAAEWLGDFGVPEGQPALAVGFEFEIAGLAVLLDLEAAAGDLGWVVHYGFPVLMTIGPDGQREPFRRIIGSRRYPLSMYVLVDYDNLPRNLTAGGVQAVADRIQEKLLSAFPSYFTDEVRLTVRLYGGWRGRTGPTRRGVDILSQVQRNFPMIIRGGGAQQVVIDASVAESLLALPHQILPHTYRTAPGIGRSLNVASAGDLRCTRPQCPADVLSAFFTLGACPGVGCVRSLEEVITRSEQKLVDTMLVTDAIHLSHEGEKTLAVVSSDDDMWPGMLSAMSTGTLVFHFHTSPGASPPIYLGSQRANYRQVEV